MLVMASFFVLFMFASTASLTTCNVLNGNKDPRISYILSTLSKHDSQLQAQDERIKTLEDENSKLKSENEVLRLQIETLQEALDNIQLTDGLREDLQEKSNEIHQKEIRKDQVIISTADTDPAIQPLRRGLSLSRRLVPPQSSEAKIAFFATVSKYQTFYNTAQRQHVIFDNVPTNVGGFYNPAHGFFTVSVSGVYVLHVDSIVDPGKHQELTVLKDGRVILATYPDARGMSGLATSSRTGVFHLNKGEEVWVVIHPDGDGSLHGSSLTSFAGWLLYAD